MSAADTIAAFGTLAPVGLIEFEKDSPDKALLVAFNMRCRLLAEIESVCRFYDADDQVPGKVAAFDMLESSIPKTPALTAQGLLAKLWIALAHVGPFCGCDELRTEADMIRRADFAEVEAFEDRLDFDQQIIFHAIRDLRHWLKFQQERLPLRRAE